MVHIIKDTVEWDTFYYILVTKMTNYKIKEIRNQGNVYKTWWTAEETSYDNTESWLTSTNVQDAIDELKASVPTVVVVPHGITEQIPENPVVGQMFYNTTDSQLLMFDGTNWIYL